MRMTMERDALLACAQAASKVASGAVARWAACALVEAADGRASFKATDLDRSVERAGAALVEEPGRVAVPAAQLARVVKSLPDGAVTLEGSGGEARVSCGKSRFGMRAIDPGCWDGPPPLGDGPSCELDAADLLALARTCAPFASKDEGRGVLAGVLLSFGGGELSAGAADGYMMARMSVPAAGDGAFEVVVQPGFLVQAAELARGAARVASDGRRVEVSSPSGAMSSRAVGGTFPSLDPFDPKAPAYALSFPRAEMSRALSRALALDGSAQVDVEASGGALRVSADCGDAGSMSDEVPCAGEASFRASASILKACVDAVDADEAEASGDAGREFTMLRGERVCAGLMHVRRP